MIIEDFKKLNWFIDNILIKVINQELIEGKKLVIIFKGKLGAGKTTIIKKIAQKLKIKENITSPTFILWQIYQFKLNNENFYFNHIDLYRVKAKDLLNLSLRSKINEKNNIFLIEWGEKLFPFLRRKKIKYLLVKIKILKKTKRKIELKWKKS